MDYNKTINLPKTEFPMRAGLPKREPSVLQRWQEQDLYHELLKKNAGKKQFSIHDGPPFSNGTLHMGHALNKALKDFINRSYAMRGYYTPYIPGWDNHGMPIESAIIKQNKLNRKTMSVSEFRLACHGFAQQYVDIQREGFQRMGVLGDWDHPYLTMNPGFEAEEVRVFGQMYQRGYIYKGKKPVYWCPKDETALAEAEIEYQDDPCTTVYVKFPMHDDQGKLGHLDHSKLYFLIWTTTIWTLPGNMGIVLNPEIPYAIVRVPNGELYIMAETLVETVLAKGGIDTFEIVETHSGSFFEYMLARHPFREKRTSLLMNDAYVTTDAGTGCVHAEPAFGMDDFQVCMRYGMKNFPVPVDDRGRHTEEDGKYAGLEVNESNPVILRDMIDLGVLFASEEITHSYPHCWRCKGPIIFRATPQWFCSVDAFKDTACEACDEVRWLPEWGKERMKSMVRERNDWCISRQRKWGLPIPVVYCKVCGKPVCTNETINAIAALFEAEGSNAWFTREAEEFLPEGFVCPHCGQNHGFEKEEDTLDGWFDSGSSHFASMKRDQGFWPCDLYLEGLDQYRGWFQAALLTAVGSTGAAQAPFRECLTHGWTVDGEGKAMHKSLGNGMDPYEIMDKYGADLLRLWAGSADYHADVRCSDAIFKQLSQSYLKFRNTARYCLGNLNDFDPNALVSAAEMLPLDRWAITRLNVLIRKCAAAYDSYEFNTVTHTVNDFCVVELSNFYLDIIKDRLYCEDRDGAKRRSAQTALYLILDTITKIMAPILAFTCDEIWQTMPHRLGDDARNVVLNEMNQTFAEYALSDAEMQEWERRIELRNEVNSVLETARADKKIGKSLEARVELPADRVDADWAQDAQALADFLIVSQVVLTAAGSAIRLSAAEGSKCMRCWKVTAQVGKDPAAPDVCSRCAEVLSRLPAFE